MRLPKEAAFYEKLYKNKIILIKIGGSEISGPEFKKTVSQIKKLAGKRIKFIIVFGGGEQIDSEWSRHSAKPRPKKDGISINSPAIIEKAVAPAYFKTIQKIQKIFGPASKIHIWGPHDVICKYRNKKELGEVGRAIQINIPKKLPQINLIGFLGTLPNGNYLNINADEIVYKILEYYPQTAEIIFLTSKGCVLNSKGKRVTMLTTKSLERIILGKQKTIKVTEGMLQKLKEIKKLLAFIPKIAITNLSGLIQEIETLEGSGTLILDTSQNVIEKAKPSEKMMVKNILYHYKDDKIFRWKPKDLKKMLDNHFLFKIKETPLGGFSILENKKNIKINALWSDNVSPGVIKTIIKYLKKESESKKKPLFITSRNQQISKILVLKNFAPTIDPENPEKIIYFWGK